MDTTDKMKSLIIDLYQAGLSLTQIAKKTGVQYSLVYCYTAGNDNITDLRKSPQRNKLSHQRSAIPPTSGKPKREKLGPCNPACPEWRGCKAGRLWVTGPVPCETLLPFEIGVEYEVDSSPTFWVMPLQVRVNVGAMG